ncbi:hypothetical protein F5880DRAFT_1618466 [Lentinula raphanica]|nr:hypothetical protein F5880DRAFT_1618466 [Lentinula raphanica]
MMMLSRSTSMMFFAAVGMITVLGLPLADERNLSPSLPATNVQAPAVQDISKRGDDEPRHEYQTFDHYAIPQPVEPKWSPGPSNSPLRASIPTLPQKRPPSRSALGAPGQPLTSNIQMTAEAPASLPPEAYPPILMREGGREFELTEEYKQKFASVEEVKKYITDGLEFLVNYHRGQIELLWNQEGNCYDAQTRAKIKAGKHKLNLFLTRVRDLKKEFTQFLQAQDQNFLRNKRFVKIMRLLNAHVLLCNGDGRVEAQFEWIKDNILGNGDLAEVNRERISKAMTQAKNRYPKADDMYLLGLAGQDHFGVSYLTKAYVEKKVAVA